MKIFGDDYFLRRYDNIYIILKKTIKKDWDSFQNLFLSHSQNKIDREFINLENPYSISILKNESNLSKLDKLFSEVLSLFPNNIIDNASIINNNIKNVNNFILDNAINKNNDIIIKSEMNAFKPKNKIIQKPKIEKFLRSKRKRSIGRIKKHSSRVGIHNRNAEDNMMRKIKNKAIESAYRLINDILENEIENSKNTLIGKEKKEKIRICKIAGIYSQELHLTFNLWLILQKLKDIFCLQISSYYTKIEADNNKNIIHGIFNSKKDEFVNSKKILDMTFFEYYHKIFLGEDEKILKELKIEKNDYNFKSYIDKIINDINCYKRDKNRNQSKNKTQIKNQKKGNNNGQADNNVNDIDIEEYRENIENLANNYENFFLKKKSRASNKIKKDEMIKDIIKNYDYKDLKNKINEIINKFKFISKNKI